MGMGVRPRRRNRYPGLIVGALTVQTRRDLCDKILAAFFKAVVLIKARRRWSQEHSLPLTRIGHRALNRRCHSGADLRIDVELHGKLRRFATDHIGLENLTCRTLQRLKQRIFLNALSALAALSTLVALLSFT